jgi:hypothetical protein
VPGDWLVSDVFLPDCTISGAYNTGDYADPTLMLFVPEICTPDVVRDAVSGDPAIKGPAWGGVTSIDTDTLALASSTSAGGIVAYGDASGLQDQYGDATLGALVSIQVQETQRFASIPGLRLDAVVEGSGWKARAGVTTVLGDEVTVESAELPLITPADVRVTYDSTTGVLTLYVDGVEEATDAVEEAAERANAGAYWYAALPAASWVTNIAAWSSVLAPPAPPSAFPFDLEFDHLWFVEGPEFVAQGYVTTDPVTNWPDEVGTLDFTSIVSVAQPQYSTTRGNLNGHPSVAFVTQASLRTGVPPVAFTPPYSIVVLGYLNDSSGYILDGRDATPRLVVGAIAGQYNLIAALAGTYAAGKKGFYVIVKSGADVGSVNGSVIMTASVHDTAFDGLTLGAAYDFGTSSRVTDTDVGLIGVYDGDITADPNWAAFQAWASSKYGITL